MSRSLTYAELAGALKITPASANRLARRKRWPRAKGNDGRTRVAAPEEVLGLVAQLAAARKRKRVATGKCEGRKSHAERRPEAVALAKALSRKRPKGGQLSLRAVSAAMAAQGFLNEHGRPFNHKSIASMLARRPQQ